MDLLGEIVGPLAAADDPQVTPLMDVRRRVAVADEVGTARDAPSDDRRIRSKQIRKCRAQGVVDALVGIDVEAPFLAALLERELLLPGIAAPCLGEQPDRPAARDVGADEIERAVRRP